MVRIITFAKVSVVGLSLLESLLVPLIDDGIIDELQPTIKAAILRAWPRAGAVCSKCYFVILPCKVVFALRNKAAVGPR
jgi:hypothetical protein